MNQMILWQNDAVVDQAIEKVFGSGEVKNSKGQVIGVALKRKGRKDLKAATGLTSKADGAKLDRMTAEQSIAALRKVKAMLTSLPENEWGLANLRQTSKKDGTRVITLKMDSINPEVLGPDVKKMAEALGLSEDEVRDLMRVKAEEDKAKNINIPATPEVHSEAPALDASTAPTPEAEATPANMTPEEQAAAEEARQMAELEAEEANAKANAVAA